MLRYVWSSHFKIYMKFCVSKVKLQNICGQNVKNTNLKLPNVKQVHVLLKLFQVTLLTEILTLCVYIITINFFMI